MPVYKTSNPRKRIKSRAGCQTCKQRRIKCDLQIPGCSRCERSGLQCPGYNKGVKWSQKYEVMLTGDSSGSKGRSLQVDECHSTWFVEGATRLEAAIAADASLARTPRQITMAGDEGLTTDRRATGTENSDGNDALMDFCGGLYDATYPEDAVWIMPDIHLETTTETLLRYYFSRVCGILCAFDSCSNPLRSLVGHLIPSYPALLHSVLAMSAAHLHQRERDRTRFSLGHRTEAISKLAMHISEVTSTRTSAVAAAPATSSTTALLLSAIMLGMTSTWHNVSSLDLLHLQGARALFKNYLVHADSQTIGPARPHPQATFLVGVMAFWESLASFHVDQPLTALDYLWEAYTRTITTDPLYPNPLTGFSTPLFIYLAKVGTLSRHLRLINCLDSVSCTDTRSGKMYYSLLDQARSIEIAVGSFVPPAHMPETGDVLTPAGHLQTMAQVYQLTILLELYRLFPELLVSTNPQGEWDITPPAIKHVFATLAISMLTLLASIADTSRTKAVQILPLLIAGSALQGSAESLLNTSVSPLNIRCLETGIMSLSSNSAIIHYWRSITLDKITGLHAYVGLDSVDYAKRIVEGVWVRADTLRPQDMVSWMDVMEEENLFTFFG